MGAAGLLAACGAEGLEPESADLAQAARGSLDAPTVAVGSPTQSTLDVTVCAGASGAPAGFSLQWALASDLEEGKSWPETYCALSASGVPRDSRFNLGPGECAIPPLSIGDLEEETGLSWGEACDVPLVCGETYLFRAFAHNEPGSAGLGRSPWSAVASGTTLACEPVDGCTRTQGYWKNHASAWPASALPMSLGDHAYDQSALLSIFGTPVGGNGLISLAHQLIAAKLNDAALGGVPAAVAADIAAADALIGDLAIPGGHLEPSETSALNTALDDFNNGRRGIAHCK